MTKARQLMKIAYATYLRNEPDIAKDIFLLAMEQPSAATEFGNSRMQERLSQAVAAGDYDEAAQYLESMEDMEDEVVLLPDEEETEEEEAAFSPGDFVDTLPEPELAPAQVASLVTLARKIKADGHPDLAKRITRALGL